jgi:hypothetical protein
MKSHRFPKIPLLLVTILVLLAPASNAADKKAPPAKPASQYLAFDAHPNEKVTVAADPCDDPKDCSFFRLPYLQHGFMPIRVVFTNDSDAPLSLDDARHRRRHPTPSLLHQRRRRPQNSPPASHPAHHHPRQGPRQEDRPGR